MKLNELSKDKLDILGALKTEDEVKAFIEKEDIELDEEQLEAISGGGIWGQQSKCQYCGKECYGAISKMTHEFRCPSRPDATQADKAMSSGMAMGMGMGLADK